MTWLVVVLSGPTRSTRRSVTVPRDLKGTPGATRASPRLMTIRLPAYPGTMRGPMYNGYQPGRDNPIAC